LNDIRADDNGTWVHGGKSQKKYSVEFDDNNVVVDDRLIKEEFSCDDENVFALVHLYHRHKQVPATNFLCVGFF